MRNTIFLLTLTVIFACKNNSNTQNIHLIPRYLLIGKDGKIISNDAPNPNNKIMLELIDKNL